MSSRSKTLEVGCNCSTIVTSTADGVALGNVLFALTIGPKNTFVFGENESGQVSLLYKSDSMIDLNGLVNVESKFCDQVVDSMC